MAQMRVCGWCKGATGRQLGSRWYSCRTCGGSGECAEPDYEGIVAAIKGRKGLRSTRPQDPRAYYVWRMARFHGGKDVTMPIMASVDVSGDPWLPELDRLADAAAKAAFGTDLAGVHRWGRALGALSHDMPGLPATAYPCGPVADADKPPEESEELR